MKLSKLLDVELVISNKINRSGNKSDSKENKGLQDENFCRTILRQKLNEKEENIINAR